MGWELHQFSVIERLVKLVLKLSLIIAQRGDRNISEMVPSTQNFPRITSHVFLGTEKIYAMH